MCQKEIYTTEALARAAAHGVGKRTRHQMRTYYCNVCDGYHLASSGKKPKRYKQRHRPKYPPNHIYKSNKKQQP